MPVPGEDKYKTFADVWGSKTSEQHRPSLKKQQEGRSRTTADSEYCAVPVKSETVRDFVLCSNCERPRCLFSAKKLTMEQVQQVEAAKEDVDFVCGGNLFPEEHPLHRIVGLRTDISCNSHVSPLFYSCKRGFPPACYACGDKNPLPVADAVRTQ